MIVSCAPWLLSQVTGIPVKAVNSALKVYDPEHVEFRDDGTIGVKQSAIIDFLEDLGCRVKLLNPDLYQGRDDAPVTAAEWAYWLGRRWPAQPFLLVQSEHVLLAQGSPVRLWDNAHPNGISPNDHPLADDPVRNFSTGEGAMVSAIKPLKRSPAYGRMKDIEAAR